MGKTCPHCKSSDLDVDPARGDTVCMNCGSVLEENTIVSEVTIQENADGSSSVVGQFVSSEGSYKPYMSGFQYGMGKESRQVTLDKGKQSIRELADLLKLNKHCVDTAFNFFKMAIAKRLSRGRRISHIVAACLYLTCRTEGTPLTDLLLDFSDVTQVNVFILGKVFLLLAKELHIHLPVLGYLRSKYETSSYPAGSTYWNSSPTEHWQIASTALSEGGGKRPTAASNTDEFNMKASSRANTFSATTRVREVPVSGIYKKEIQEFRSRTPSARGVRAAAITNRSWVASQSARASSIGPATAGTRASRSSEQSVRLRREYEQLEATRERKRQAQMSGHRLDRMYYMHGSSTKIHPKYGITEDELGRIRSIAISQGLKIPVLPIYPEDRFRMNRRPSSTSGPHSTPRGAEEEEDEEGKTVIPTAAEVLSQDGTDKASSGNKEDRATSDNEEDDLARFEMMTPTPLPDVDPAADAAEELKSSSVANSNGDALSVKSESAVGKRNVTFLTETADENLT